MNDITINASSNKGATCGCIYTCDDNGADPECCYTYTIIDGVLVMHAWVGKDAVATHECIVG